MCLKISEDHPKRLTAEEDILVFKTLNVKDNSPFYGMEYKPGETYTAEMVVVRWKSRAKGRGVRRGQVEQGLHAYVDHPSNTKNYHYVSDKVVGMMIPKGGHYYIGATGDIVSDILVAGNLEHIPGDPKYDAVQRLFR